MVLAPEVRVGGGAGGEGGRVRGDTSEVFSTTSKADGGVGGIDIEVSPDEVGANDVVGDGVGGAAKSKVSA